VKHRIASYTLLAFLYSNLQGKVIFSYGLKFPTKRDARNFLFFAEEWNYTVRIMSLSWYLYGCKITILSTMEFQVITIAKLTDKDNSNWKV